jgi:hypothetical protein
MIRGLGFLESANDVDSPSRISCPVGGTAGREAVLESKMSGKGVYLSSPAGLCSVASVAKTSKQ